MTACPVVLVLTADALPVARRIEAALPGASLHALAGRIPEADTQFSETLDHVRSLFSAYVPIIGVCPAELLIRAIAPLLEEGRGASPVVAVSTDGQWVVPLVGCAHGGNDLARHLADLLGGQAAATSEAARGFTLALDRPPPGWRLANPQDARPVMAELLVGAPVRIEGDAPWLTRLGLTLDDGAEISLCATTEPVAGSATCLVYHPCRVVLGAGTNRGCAPDELIALAMDAIAEAGIAAGTVAVVATLERKADDPALRALARHLGVPLRIFSAEELERETPRLANPSQTVFAETGCHGVSEGAALAGSGPQGVLIVDKRKNGRATVALAAAPGPLVGAELGRPAEG